MPGDTRDCAAACAPARLLIHAHADANCAAGRSLAGALRWLIVHARLLQQRHAPVLAAVVQIDDLLGRRFVDTEQTRPMIEVALPAGTYHVTFRRGSWQRRYTVTLEQGATVHLHPRVAIVPP